MMKCAYDLEQLRHLGIIEIAKGWHTNKIIDASQLEKITERYPVSLYHPGLVIRILLFIASLLALSGITGILALVVFAIGDEEYFIGISSIVYGVISLIVLEQLFINRNRHYRSGVTEALLYHALGFLVLGIALVTDGQVEIILLSAVVLPFVAAQRYLDLISCITAMASFVGLGFYLAERSDLITALPFFFMLTFGLFVFWLKKMQVAKIREHLAQLAWTAEFISWCILYLCGNYFVVRGLTINLMDQVLEPGTDIPFAGIFYLFTALIPLAYLYFGIKRKDVILLRVSLFAAAMSVFTFNFYFGFKDFEIASTLGGMVATVGSVLLIRLLKKGKAGFTSDFAYASAWLDSNAEAFVISQTVGGNQQPAGISGGGTFGGGGASGDF